MLNKDIFRSVLVAENVAITEGKLTSIVGRYNQQAELLRLGEATYNDLINMDQWSAVNLSDPEPSRQWLQNLITTLRTRLPLLPAYVPLSTAELKAT